MNKLTAKLEKSPYCPEKHLCYFIDEINLIDYFKSSDSYESITGLIPNLLKDWMIFPEEEAIVWSKADLREREFTNVPILMCPDDLDFSCTIIIVEMKREKGIVYWNKFGFNQGEDVQTMGRNVDWISSIPKFKFLEEDYFKMMSDFKLTT